jgi:hypothetical protein
LASSSICSQASGVIGASSRLSRFIIEHRS